MALRDVKEGDRAASQKPKVWPGIVERSRDRGGGKRHRWRLVGAERVAISADRWSIVW